MSEIIDVLTAIDVQSILGDLTSDRNSPGYVDPDNIHMIVNADNVLEGQAGGELKFSAQVGDLVRWRETSLSSNFEYSVMFYKFVDNDPNNLLLTEPRVVGGLNEFTHAPVTANEIQPIQGPMPWSGGGTSAVYHYYESNVQKIGSVTYHWWFQINDAHNGQVVGYGQWDPFIVIS